MILLTMQCITATVMHVNIGSTQSGDGWKPWPAVRSHNQWLAIEWRNIG